MSAKDVLGKQWFHGTHRLDWSAKSGEEAYSSKMRPRYVHLGTAQAAVDRIHPANMKLFKDDTYPERWTQEEQDTYFNTGYPPEVPEESRRLWSAQIRPEATVHPSTLFDPHSEGKPTVASHEDRRSVERDFGDAKFDWSVSIDYDVATGKVSKVHTPRWGNTDLDSPSGKDVVPYINEFEGIGSTSVLVRADMVHRKRPVGPVMGKPYTARPFTPKNKGAQGKLFTGGTGKYA